MRWRWLVSGVLSACLGLGGLAPAALAAVSAGGTGWSAFGSRQSVAATLVASNPPIYAQDYRAAEAYLAQLVSGGGIASATPQSQAWIAGALDLTGHPHAAATVIADLLGEQAADGSWGHDVGVTGSVLWAVIEHARLAEDTAALRANWGAIQKGAAYLVAHQDPLTGGVGDVAGGPYPAFTLGEALQGLRYAAAAAQVLGHGSAASAWGLAASRAAAALESDQDISHTGTVDFFANALFDPGTGSLLQQREVAGASALSLTYPGWGVKVGPGYFDGNDWVGAEPTFLYALAAVWNGLPNLGGVQYDAGLRMQCADGEIGYEYHPPVGPQTGGFQAGPNCQDSRTQPGFTALYLLATHALFGVRPASSGAGVTTNPTLPPPWKSATVGVQGAEITLSGRPAVDPTVPFQRTRIAVVVNTRNGNESGLEMGVAYEALTQGYDPWVFWYLNNDFGPLHNLYNLLHSLGRYQVIVLGHNVLADPTAGSYQCSGGACPNPPPAQWLDGAAAQLAAWVQAGGRLVSTGDRVALPLTGALAAQTAAAPAPITRVAVTAAGGAIGLTQALPRRLKPGAADYYRNVGGAYQVLATGRVDGQAQPVMLAAQVGAGRVLESTIGLSSPAHDLGPAFGAILGWAVGGLPQAPAASRAYGALAADAAGAITADWWDPAAGLYRAPSGTPDGCGDGSTAVWPVSQVYFLADALASSTLWSEVDIALPHYYNPLVQGTGAYVACPGGSRAYYDDNGWILNAMLERYALQPDPALLISAEHLFTFMQTGWRSGVGGEEFYPGCGCAEQVATGTFLDAALRLYLATHNPSYLTWAQTISTWDQTYMRADPSANGLYYDFIQGTGDRVTNFTQFTYDTGVVLQADALFYQATGNPAYLREGERLAAAASAAFVNPASGAMWGAGASGPAFNAIYFEGARLLSQEDQDAAWLAVAQRSARAAVLWDAQAAPGGTTYGPNWGGVNTWYAAAHLDVLSQAGTARLFALLAAPPSLPLSGGTG